MVLILCNYNLKEYEWHSHNCDIKDFVKITCYKRYDEYVKWKSYENSNPKNDNPKLETEE